MESDNQGLPPIHLPAKSAIEEATNLFDSIYGSLFLESLNLEIDADTDSPHS